jgi:hypothetical protein
MSAGGYSGYKLEYSDWSPVRFTRGLAAAREERLLCGPEMFVCVRESVGVCVCVALLRKLTKLCSVEERSVPRVWTIQTLVEALPGSRGS